MAIFGMNGLKFLGLDLAILFVLYGMKEVAMTTDDVKAVEKFAFRKALSKAKGTKADRKREIARFRAAQLQKLKSNKRYKDTDAEFSKAYGKKEWLR